MQMHLYTRLIYIKTVREYYRNKYRDGANRLDIEDRGWVV